MMFCCIFKLNLIKKNDMKLYFNDSYTMSLMIGCGDEMVPSILMVDMRKRVAILSKPNYSCIRVMKTYQPRI